MVIDNTGEGYFEKADVWVLVKYNLEADTAIITTNLKRGKVKEFIQEYLATQIGAGEDKSQPNSKKEYEIRIECDLNGDIFRVHSDTGNKGLREGILLHVLQKSDLEKLIA